MQLTNSVKWNSSDNTEFGRLLGVGCDTHGEVYVAAGKDLYHMKGDDLELERELTESADEFEVFTLAFDTIGRFYVASNKHGLQVYRSVKKPEGNDENLIFSDPDWIGPFCLSHPSGQLCGVNYKNSKMGIMSYANWNDDETEIIVRPKPAWGDDFGEWLMKDRDPIYSIRRSWYSDRIMIYIADPVSYQIPMDGIRSLHMMFAPDKRNINHLEHTFMSCPWDEELKMPFTIEIPHKGVSSELLLLTPRGVVTERGQHFIDFEDYEDESTYTRAFSATDIEGIGSKRSKYVLGFTTSEHKNSVRIITI